MAGMLSTLICFIIALAVIFSILCSISGESSKGNMIFINCITVTILYVLILYMFNVDGSGRIFNSSIPLLEAVEKYGSVRVLLSSAPSEFSLCFVQLVTVALLISFMSNVFSLEQAGFVSKLLTRVVLVFAGLLLYGFVMDSISSNIVIKYCVYALETLLTGGSILYTPIMMASMITGLKTDNYVLIYVMEQLPKTSIGKAVSTAVTSSILFVVMMLVLETQYGSVVNIMQETVDVFVAGGAVLIMIMGIYIMLKGFKRS